MGLITRRGEPGVAYAEFFAGPGAGGGIYPRSCEGEGFRLAFFRVVKPVTCQKPRADRNRPTNEADMCFRINRYASWVPIADSSGLRPAQGSGWPGDAANEASLSLGINRTRSTTVPPPALRARVRFVAATISQSNSWWALPGHRNLLREKQSPPPSARILTCRPGKILESRRPCGLREIRNFIFRTSKPEYY